jgi:hypothetical protein
MSACFSDLSQGQSFPDYRFVVSEDNCRDFDDCVSHGPITLTRASGSTEQLDTLDTKHVSLFQMNNFLVMKAAFKFPDNVLHAKEQLRSIAPVNAGDKLRMDFNITAKYVKRDRKYFEFGIDIYNEDTGNKVMEIGRTAVWPC